MIISGRHEHLSDRGVPLVQGLGPGTLLTPALPLSRVLPPGAQLLPVQGPLVYSALPPQAIIQVPSVKLATQYLGGTENLRREHTMPEGSLKIPAAPSTSHWAPPSPLSHRDALVASHVREHQQVLPLEEHARSPSPIRPSQVESPPALVKASSLFGNTSKHVSLAFFALGTHEPFFLCCCNLYMFLFYDMLRQGIQLPNTRREQSASVSAVLIKNMLCEARSP